jgi:hypothetical protein
MGRYRMVGVVDGGSRAAAEVAHAKRRKIIDVTGRAPKQAGCRQVMEEIHFRCFLIVYDGPMRKKII